jgi:hypothetical protein
MQEARAECCDQSFQTTSYRSAAGIRIRMRWTSSNGRSRRCARLGRWSRTSLDAIALWVSCVRRAVMSDRRQFLLGLERVTLHTSSTYLPARRLMRTLSASDCIQVVTQAYGIDGLI